MCKICEISGQNCIHTQLKCSNCTDKHAANSNECNVVIAAKKLNSNSTSNSISSNASLSASTQSAFAQLMETEEEL